MGSNGGNELAFASGYNSSKIRCSKVSLMKILYSKYTQSFKMHQYPLQVQGLVSIKRKNLLERISKPIK